MDNHTERPEFGYERTEEEQELLQEIKLLRTQIARLEAKVDALQPDSPVASGPAWPYFIYGFLTVLGLLLVPLLVTGIFRFLSQ